MAFFWARASRGCARNETTCTSQRSKLLDKLLHHRGCNLVGKVVWASKKLGNIHKISRYFKIFQGSALIYPQVQQWQCSTGYPGSSGHPTVRPRTPPRPPCLRWHFASVTTWNHPPKDVWGYMGLQCGLANQYLAKELRENDSSNPFFKSYGISAPDETSKFSRPHGQGFVVTAADCKLHWFCDTVKILTHEKIWEGSQHTTQYYTSQ